ncbi:MAG: hypothetical protein IKC31_05870 [Clostridia bacterium]|nr:hypothetical protein [Clostridia bacterium]
MQDQNQNHREEEKREAPSIALPKNKFLTWLENFWYHYKIHTVVALFVLLCLIACFAQCSGKENGDITVVFAGGCTLTNTDRSTVVDLLDSLALPKEDGDTLTVVFNHYSIFSEEELRKYYTDENGNFDNYAYQIALSSSKTNAQTFGDSLLTGHSALYFVRESLYQSQNMQKLARPLSKSLGATPECAYDEYAIRLCDTEFYQYYEALHFFPEDTLIVLTEPYIFGTTSDEEVYAQFEALFRAIAQFKAP